MPEHQTPLIATIAAGLMLAYVFGLVAHRLRVQPLVGYLLAGVVVGPFTPGFTADPALAAELAEIGVILLMFGVGLHFSLKDLMSVARIAVPGAIVQIVIATLMGAGLARVAGLVVAGGPRLRPRPVGRQHRRHGARLPGPPHPRDRARPHRRRLAGGRGPRHDPGAGAAADRWPW